MGLIPKGMREMGNMTGIMKEAQNAVSGTMKQHNELLEAILDKTNEQTMALVSIYEAIEALAKKDGVKLPKPHVEMKIEEADEKC